MRYMLTRLIGNDSGNEFTINDTKVQELKEALEAAGIKNVYYDPIYDKSSIDKSGNTPIVELTDLGKPYRFPGKIDTAVVVGDLTDPLSYYDVNNIANRWTISQIDFNNSTFVVSKSSRI